MNNLIQVAAAMWDVLLDSAPYIILGIVAAGLVKMVLSQEFIGRHLHRGRYRSVLKAALLGIPLPL